MWWRKIVKTQPKDGPVTLRQQKVEKAAEDFAVRFEGVMKDLAQS